MIKSANVTIMVADMDRAIKFYTESLGFKLAFRAGNEWAEVSAPGVQIGLHPKVAIEDNSNSQENISLGFEVDDMDAALVSLENQGISFEEKVDEQDYGKLAHFADPDGTPLYLIELNKK